MQKATLILSHFIHTIPSYSMERAESPPECHCIVTYTCTSGDCVTNDIFKRSYNLHLDGSRNHHDFNIETIAKECKNALAEGRRGHIAGHQRRGVVSLPAGQLEERPGPPAGSRAPGPGFKLHEPRLPRTRCWGGPGPTEPCSSDRDSDAASESDDCCGRRAFKLPASRPRRRRAGGTSGSPALWLARLTRTVVTRMKP
jgi:hypothetical protein